MNSASAYVLFLNLTTKFIYSVNLQSRCYLIESKDRAKEAEQSMSMLCVVVYVRRESSRVFDQGTHVIKWISRGFFQYFLEIEQLTERTSHQLVGLVSKWTKGLDLENSLFLDLSGRCYVRYPRLQYSKVVTNDRSLNILS